MALAELIKISYSDTIQFIEGFKGRLQFKNIFDTGSIRIRVGAIQSLLAMLSPSETKAGEAELSGQEGETVVHNIWSVGVHPGNCNLRWLGTFFAVKIILSKTELGPFLRIRQVRGRYVQLGKPEHIANSKWPINNATKCYGKLHISVSDPHKKMPPGSA